MVVKSLFDEPEKNLIISRIIQLTASSNAKWGEMNVTQMLTHCQRPILACYGKHKVQGSFILRLIGPLFKSILYNNTPYKPGLPTDKTYVVADEREFEKERTTLVELVSQFSENNISEIPHPVFGKLNREQWSKAT